MNIFAGACSVLAQKTTRGSEVTGTMAQIPVHLTAACWNKYHKL